MTAPAQFKRCASLIIGSIAGVNGRELAGLRIAFKVKKTSSSSPNTAEIKVYNLARETRNQIVARNTALVLRAGYGDVSPLPLIASGVVQRAEHTPQPPDVESDLEIRDGGIGLDESTAKRAYKSGTPIRQIVDDLLATMPDIVRGTMTAEALSQTLTRKRSFSGPTRASLDALATAYGFEWSIQDGVAQVLDRTQASGPLVTATVISKDTGMIGSPTKTNAGCRVSCLLQPILPGSFVRVESDFCTGYFKALTVEHDGDTFEGDFKTQVEAKAIDKWVGPGAKSKK